MSRRYDNTGSCGANYAQLSLDKTYGGSVAQFTIQSGPCKGEERTEQKSHDVVLDAEQVRDLVAQLKALLGDSKEDIKPGKISGEDFRE